MKSLTARVKSYLPRPHKAISSCSEIPCMTTLAGLPPELLLSISDFLPLVDLICFSLCNHRLLQLSQRQINRLPPRTKDDQLSILNRLERDFPKYFACEVCSRLHRYDGSESFGLSGLAHKRTCRLPCVRREKRFDPHWFDYSLILRTHFGVQYTANHLSFLQLKLAMRRFYYGPRSYQYRFSILYTAQICPRHLGLCIRMHDIVLLRTRDELIFRPGRRSDSNPLYTLEVCAHFGLLTITTPVVESLHDGEKASFAHTCYRCNTDSQIEIGEFESKITLVMTRWVNLGPCLTKEDLLWKTHVWFPGYPRARLDEDDSEDLLTRIPRLCFEEKAPQSFEDLQSGNLSYLRDQQYKNVMPFIAAGIDVWYMSYKDPSKKKGRGIEFDPYYAVRPYLEKIGLSRK
ncbi:Cyclin-like F-box [Penicillium camemberti]|uniref:Cyclin-like F-box n=1 Tax=Penicillium camemberti (strain FM 013) TaxID=1429867 RepID=A0A0G4PGA6_PENC3|nr:Cyclin-like F-box [Penicillium camemberti]